MLLAKSQPRHNQYFKKVPQVHKSTILTGRRKNEQMRERHLTKQWVALQNRSSELWVPEPFMIGSDVPDLALWMFRMFVYKPPGKHPGERYDGLLAHEMGGHVAADAWVTNPDSIHSSIPQSSDFRPPRLTSQTESEATSVQFVLYIIYFKLLPT